LAGGSRHSFMQPKVAHPLNVEQQLNRRQPCEEALFVAKGLKNMKPQESDFFTKFFNNIIHGKEYPAYDVQIKKLTLEKSEKGHFEKTIQAENRTLCINYYMSHKLDTLFVLTAHIVRKGEPRPKELEALKKYVEEIERKSSD